MEDTERRDNNNPSLDSFPRLPKRRRVGANRPKKKKKIGPARGTSRRYPDGFQRMYFWLSPQALTTMELEAERLSDALFCRITVGDIARAIIERFVKAWSPAGPSLVAPAPKFSMEKFDPAAGEVQHIEAEVPPSPPMMHHGKYDEDGTLKDDYGG